MKFLKRNKLLVLSFLILLGMLIYSFSITIKNEQMNINNFKAVQERCRTDLENKDENTDELLIELCEEIINKPIPKKSFFEIYSETIGYNQPFRSMIFLISLFIMIPAFYDLARFLKNNLISNYVTRTSYKTILKKIFLKAYQPALLLVIIILLNMLLSYLYVGTFEVLSTSNLSWREYTTSAPAAFIIAALGVVFLNSILYINIGLCIARKYHNFFLIILLTFIVILGIQIFCEVVINGMLISSVLGYSTPSTFSIMNLFAFDDSEGTFMSLITPAVFLGISYVILYFLYRNKEKLIIDCEKN